jgi:superfamily I DNA/RNA helicase
MRTLERVTPTPEQLIVIDNPDPGFWLIKGAAGSGKTTTALLRLRFLVRYWRERRASLGLVRPVRVLVLTFNRTLRGYIAELTEQQVPAGEAVDLDISTFGFWSSALSGRSLLEAEPQELRLRQLALGNLSWPTEFMLSEVNYVQGLYMPEERADYLTAKRTGRGRHPTVTAEQRQILLEKVLAPYDDWKKERDVVDWNDLAVDLAWHQRTDPYDIVVVDEAQDFSANQVRAVVNHLVDDDFTCTFIRDTTQRIYPNAFVWRDVDVQFDPGHSRHLETNYRNTKQIAAFARPLVHDIEQGEDDSLPDFSSAKRDGSKPTVLRGKFSQQLDWAIDYLKAQVIGTEETVAFLHPKGGRWFGFLRRRLNEEGIEWTSLTRQTEWPTGSEQVALSTMHSAKGLEFDHVVILGFNAEVVQHGDEDDDVRLDGQRRLLAMAVGRARASVVLGYKPSDASRLIEFLDPETYRAVDL